MKKIKLNKKVKRTVMEASVLIMTLLGLAGFILNTIYPIKYNKSIYVIGGVPIIAAFILLPILVIQTKTLKSIRKMKSKEHIIMMVMVIMMFIVLGNIRDLFYPEQANLLENSPIFIIYVAGMFYGLICMPIIIQSEYSRIKRKVEMQKWERITSSIFPTVTGAFLISKVY